MAPLLFRAALTLTLVTVSAATGQRITTLTSAPRLGAPLDVTYRGAVGDAYLMFMSAPFPGSIAVPGIGGSFFLDPLTTLLLYSGAVGATGRDTRGVPIANDPSLFRAGFDLQPLNLTPGLQLDWGANEVQVTITRGIGTITLAAGQTIGALQRVDNATMGQSQPMLSVAIGPTLDLQDPRGFLEGRQYVNSEWLADINALRGDLGGAFYLAAPFSPAMAGAFVRLPNGRDLMAVWPAPFTNAEALAAHDRATGGVQVLPGTLVVNTGPLANSPGFFGPMGGSADGNVALIAFRDSTNQLQGTGVPDRVFLVRTDGTAWPQTGTALRNITATTLPSHRYVAGSMIVAHERVFVRGTAAWYSAPLDGSASLAAVALPNTGTGLPNAYAGVEWRMSQDRRTVCFLIASGSHPASVGSADVVAITGIGGSGFTIRNITAFPVATRLSVFGESTLGTRMHADLSPDGTRLAFLGVNPFAGAGPIDLYVARTDGSQAGTLVPVTAGQFGSSVAVMNDVNFVDDDAVIFTAGETLAGRTDVYGLRPSTGVIRNITRTTTGSLVPPFTQNGIGGTVLVRGTFRSLNRRWLYFVRGYGVEPPRANNLVGIDTATLLPRDITGGEFSGGTAPAIYRGSLYLSRRNAAAGIVTDYQLRRSASPGSTDAFFVAEPAAGASATVQNDCNLFRFDIENGGQAVQLTSYTGSGPETTALNLGGISVSPDGGMVGYATRRGRVPGTDEDVFVMPAAGGPVSQLSPSLAGQVVLPGSIWFTGAPVDAVAWSVETSASPQTQYMGQWSLVSGQNGPLILTEDPRPYGTYSVSVIGASARNP